jgi:membrane protein implicated in regulation of membrane protease activity
VKTFTRYTLFQIPGWVGAGLILYGVYNWFGLAGWIAIAFFAAFVAKDFILYRFVRHAYEARWNPGPVELIGQRGISLEEVAPSGYVRVRGELWKAEVARGAGPVPADAPIRVQAVRGDTLLVMIAPEEEPPQRLTPST